MNVWFDAGEYDQIINAIRDWIEEAEIKLYDPDYLRGLAVGTLEKLITMCAYPKDDDSSSRLTNLVQGAGTVDEFEKAFIQSVEEVMNYQPLTMMIKYRKEIREVIDLMTNNIDEKFTLRRIACQ